MAATKAQALEILRGANAQSWLEFRKTSSITDLTGEDLSGLDLYLNIVGGLRISEPALDAAVVAALISSFRNTPIDPHTVVFGEVGLTGELRAVNFTRERLAEAARLQFKRAVIPARNRAEQSELPKGIQVIGAATVADLADALFE